MVRFGRKLFSVYGFRRLGFGPDDRGLKYGDGILANTVLAIRSTLIYEYIIQCKIQFENFKTLLFFT